VEGEEEEEGEEEKGRVDTATHIYRRVRIPWGVLVARAVRGGQFG